MRTPNTGVPNTDATVEGESKPEDAVETTIFNHLIGEWVSVRSVIDRILNTQRLEVLNAVREQPATVSALQEYCSMSRPTANKHVSDLADLGLVFQQSSKAYSITGGGAIALRILREHLDDIERNTLAEVARSSAKPRLLQAFAATSNRSASIETFDRAFSQSTRSTNRRSFEQEGWITREDGSYRLTSTGESVLDSYVELEQAFEQIIDRAPCLRDLGPECEELPVAELSDADQIIARIGSPSMESARRYEQLIESDFEYCRGLSSYYEAGYSRAYASAIKAGKEVEIVFTPKVLREFPFGNPKEWGPIKTQVFSENCSGNLYSDSLPVSFAIFDRDIVVFGAPDPAEIDLSEYGITGTIFTDDKAVIKWAIDLFESYRRDSKAEPDMNSTADIVSEIQSHVSDLDLNIGLRRRT